MKKMAYGLSAMQNHLTLMLKTNTVLKSSITIFLLMTTIIFKDTLELNLLDKKLTEERVSFFIAYVLGQMQHEAAIPQLIEVKPKIINQIEK